MPDAPAIPEIATPGAPPAPAAPAAPAAPDPKAAVPAVPEAKVEAKPDAKPEGKVEEKAPEARKTLEQKLAEKKAAEAGKPADKKPEEKAGEKKQEEAKPDDIQLTLPKDAQVDEKVLGEFKSTIKDLGLKSEGAQKLFDFYSKAEAAKVAAQQAADDKQQDAWEDEIMKWPDADEKLGLAKKAILKLADPDAQAFFQVPFVGSNPSIVKFLAAVGKLMSEAPMHEGSTPAPKAWTLDDVFPSMAKKK